MDDKTESLLIASNRTSLPSNLQSYRNTDILFSLQAKNLGVALSNNLSMEKHVNNICSSAYIKFGELVTAFTTSLLMLQKPSSERLFCQ